MGSHGVGGAAGIDGAERTQSRANQLGEVTLHRVRCRSSGAERATDQPLMSTVLVNMYSVLDLFYVTEFVRL